MWLLTIFILIFAPLLYILFARITININSTTNLYSVRLNHIAAVSIMPGEHTYAEIRIIGWKRVVELFKPQGELQEKTTTEKKDTRQNRRKPQGVLKKLIRVLQSFRIRECYISADTGDMPLNGILYPWVYMLSRYTGKQMTINFSGENILILKIENTVARMLWAYIKS